MPFSSPPLKCSTANLRGKFLQTVILLVISLFLMNWYFLGERRYWNNYKVVIQERDTPAKVVDEKDIQAKKSRSFYNLTPFTKTPNKYFQETAKTSNILTPSEEKNEEEPKSESSRSCPKLSLQPTSDAKYGLCTPHEPSESSCELAKKMYFIRPELSTCKKRKISNICRMDVSETSQGNVIHFKCNEALCKQGKNDSFKVYSVDPETGSTNIVNTFTTVKDLKKELPAIASKNKQNKFNFVFIGCTNHHGKQVSQLLPLEPHFIIEKTKKTRNEHIINVNILLIDSLSRAHFYRSLPKTVSTFKYWRQNPRAVPAEVFDFELFQALHGHTAVNMHAFYTGELFPVELKDDTPPLNISALFGHYKRAGFQTVWQEDLCWQGIWGLMTDLGVENWRSLQAKMKSTYIDHTGLTHSSCKILNSIGIDSPFNGPSGDQICYNGQFQHSYFLRSITDTLKAISVSPKAKPIFLYTALNVVHDQRSVRTQTLDGALQSYVTSVAKDENTLTIILADHGNTYTWYAAEYLEGHFEMFHPSLFFIVPDKVASLLGEDAMSALKVNQRRLVTMIDLHRSLMALAAPLRGVRPGGVFAPISENRTCDDLELRTPNLCVCEGWDIPAVNDSWRIPVAEFAIGELNNRLQEQYYKLAPIQNRPQVIKQSCQRLQPLWFENVRVRNSKIDRSLITSMDIRVKAGDVVPQKQDIFHVEVQTKEISGRRSLDMRLLNYDRHTLFGKYKICADGGVELKLCVCSQNASKRSLAPEFLEGLEHFGQRSVIESISNKPCLWLVERRYSEGKAYEVANSCLHQPFRVKIDAATSNKKLSRQLPVTLDVKPGQVLFAFSVRRHLSHMESAISVTAMIENEADTVSDTSLDT